jgi:hypothetical protein
VAAAAATNVIGGKIQFATPVYDFGKAKSGELVRYTYVFTNLDSCNEVLEVRGVQPQCGCTTAGEWTKRTAPGKTGAIPIQFNSANYNGPVLKMITVTTSDKTQPSLVLQLKGTIWRPIEVNPMYAIITVAPDAGSASTSVRIVNNLPEPVDVFAPECNNRSFVAQVKTNQPGRDFLMTVSTAGAMLPGTTSGQITLKTTSTNTPSVNVIVMANVQPPLTVSPPQLNLPIAPLANATTNTITIQNNSTNALVLTEPLVSAKDVSVQIKEMQPGRLYVALVGFPQGFEIPPTQPAVLTIKSSLPQLPLIKVPVMQAPRPLAPPRPAAAAPAQMAPRLVPPPPSTPVQPPTPAASANR